MLRKFLLTTLMLLAMVSCSKGDPSGDTDATISAAVDATMEAIPMDSPAPAPENTPIPLPTNTPKSENTTDSLAQLEVALWPDYDDPSVLVILSGSLPDDSVLPAAITVPVPNDARLNAVARMSDDGLFDDIEYDTSEAGELTLITPDPGFTVEYYAPYTQDEDRRSYTFQWQSDMNVGEMTLVVQEPAFAIGLTIDQRVIDSLAGWDGLLYHDISAGQVAPGDTYALTISYALDPDELSAEAMRNGVLEPTPAVEIVKENLDSGWIRYELPGYGFAIALPPGWLSYDTSTTLDDDVIEIVGENNSDLFGTLNDLALSDLSQQGIVFMAYDFSAVTPVQSGPPGMNVMVQERNLLPPNDKLDIPYEQLAMELGLDEPIQHQEVFLDGIPAEKLNFEMGLAGLTGPMAVENTQYFAIVDGNVVTITFSVTSELGKDYEEIFKRIIQSVEWLEQDW